MAAATEEAIGIDIYRSYMTQSSGVIMNVAAECQGMLFECEISV